MLRVPLKKKTKNEIEEDRREIERLSKAFKELYPEKSDAELVEMSRYTNAFYKKKDHTEEEEEEEDKKFDILKLRESLELDVDKNVLEHIEEESSVLKKHLNKINTAIKNDIAITKDYVVDILNNFLEKSDEDNIIYSKTVERLKTDLISNKISLDEFINFAQKFQNQKYYTIDKFYKKFFKTHPITLTDLFGDELDDLSSSSDEEPERPSETKSKAIPKALRPFRKSHPLEESVVNEKIDRVRQKISKHEQPPFVKIVEPDHKRRGRVALVEVPQIPPFKHIQRKPLADKIFFQTMDDLSKKDCEFLYKKIPWVKDIINHIYVNPIEGVFDNILDLEKWIEYENEKYYYPKEMYYNIQCHSHKVQDGDVLTIVKDEKTYRMKVAIDTNTKGIVLQNEDMLKAEIDYIRVWGQNKGSYIADLKNGNPSEDMVFLAKFELSSSLQDAISGNVPIEYRSTNSKFIESVINTILKNSKSGESFVRLLTNLIVFLKINISFVTSSVFVKRLRELVYLPGTLPFLTDADKLPEIFLVENVPEDTKNFVLKKLEEQRIHFTRNFFENCYINSSIIRKPTKSILWTKPTQQIELPNIKTICKNREHVKDENDEDIVFYTDQDEIYCFNVYKLYHIFKNDAHPTNPYTNRPFSTKFIQMFLTRYASKPLVKKIERVQNVYLTSMLERLIENELTLLENRLIETENPGFIAKFRHESTTESTPESAPRKCMECKKELQDADTLKSVFRNKEVFFCGYDCLEKNKSFK